MPANRPNRPAARDPAAQTPAPAARPRRPRAAGAYVFLDARWIAWLVVGSDAGPDDFRRVARRLADDFGAVVAVAPPKEDGTECAEVQVGAARLLLARKPGTGVRLGAERVDLDILLRIAAAYRARPRGWRWNVNRVLSRLGLGG
jgi:hypothetical protein